MKISKDALDLLRKLEQIEHAKGLVDNKDGEGILLRTEYIRRTFENIKNRIFGTINSVFIISNYECTAQIIIKNIEEGTPKEMINYYFVRITEQSDSYKVEQMFVPITFGLIL